MLSLSICPSVFAQTNLTQEEETMPIEQLQELFPYIALGDDGYVENYESDSEYINSISECNDTEELLSVDSVYEAEYEDGKCWLNIYTDGSYSAYGYEKEDDDSESMISPLSTGYSSASNSYYKTYWRYYMATYNMSYKYKFTTSSSTGYSRYTEKTSVTVSYTPLNTGMTMSAGQLWYERQKQTSSSAPATLIGRSSIAMNGSAFVTLTLTTYINGGGISVKGSESPAGDN